MKTALLAPLLATLFASAPCAAADVLHLLGTYRTGLAGETSGETAALRGERLYVTNADDASLDIVDVTDPARPQRVKRVDLKAYGAQATSVDVSARNLVAVALAAADKTAPGRVVLLTPAGQVVRSVTVGALPDMLAFTPQGDRLLVANEGEPDCYGAGCTDPEGSVSVITVQPLKPELPVATLGFAHLDAHKAALIAQGIRIFGPNASVAQDLEPEYITIDADGANAWVSLQENNAIARLDLAALTVAGLLPLGYKDHSQPGQGLDASDKDNAIAIQPWPVLGMYQPDAIASYRSGGRTLLVSANEGDARDYPGFAEEARAKDIAALAGIAETADNKQLGRLTVTTAPPAGDSAHPYAFGARSLSIWDAASGGRLWDSGDELERRTAAALPAHFNSNNDENNFDNRSDNKGPEPEGLALGTVAGKTYAFVGLERTGGIAVYDISDASAPVFRQYLATRTFAGDAAGPDSGPEVLRFVAAEHSPSGQPLLVVANEISGSVNLFAINAD